MNRREFIKYSAVGVYSFSLPINMAEEKQVSPFIDFATKTTRFLKSDFSEIEIVTCKPGDFIEGIRISVPFITKEWYQMMKDNP